MSIFRARAEAVRAENDVSEVDLTKVNRYALESRLMLDLVCFELYRLRLPAATRVSVHAASEAFFEDLSDRLADDFTLLPKNPGASAPQAGEGPSEAVIYLLSLEEDRGAVPEGAQHLIVAFRNTLSHKSVLYRGWRGLPFPAFERRLKKSHELKSAWGLMGLNTLLLLGVAALAEKLELFDWSFSLTDLAMTKPVCQGSSRYFCPFGVVSGRKR